MSRLWRAIKGFLGRWWLNILIPVAAGFLSSTIGLIIESLLHV